MANFEIPEGWTVESIAELIIKTARPLTYKFRFGVWSPEDLQQIALLEGFKVLKHYDNKRPLENLLYIHIKRRLLNIRRKGYCRLEEPCSQCPLGAFIPPGTCTAYKKREDCSLFYRWQERNRVKRALEDSFEIGEADLTSEGLDMALREYSEIIDRALDPYDRKLYLLLIHRGKISKQQRIYICQIIRDVVHSTENPSDS